MPAPFLDVDHRLAGVAFKPMPVEIFSNPPELDNEVSGQVLELGLAPFLPPEAEQGWFVRTHDDPGVGAAYEMSAVAGTACPHIGFHRIPPLMLRSNN